MGRSSRVIAPGDRLPLSADGAQHCARLGCPGLTAGRDPGGVLQGVVPANGSGGFGLDSKLCFYPIERFSMPIAQTSLVVKLGGHLGTEMKRTEQGLASRS